MRRLAAFSLIALCALAGCSSVIGTARSSVLATARPPAALEAVGESGDGGARISGAIVRSQLLALIGKEPGAAKTMLAGYGHDGEVTVAPGAHHYDRCGENRVCAFDVPESGMGVHDPITLFVNPGLKIAAPPI